MPLRNTLYDSFNRRHPGAMDGIGNDEAPDHPGRIKIYPIQIKGLSVNKSFVPASGFWIASAAPQSQNPQRRPATPAVLLNRRDQNRSQNPARSLKGLFTDKPLSTFFRPLPQAQEEKRWSSTQAYQRPVR
jgi:hypothetical protein